MSEERPPAPLLCRWNCGCVGTLPDPDTGWGIVVWSCDDQQPTGEWRWCRLGVEEFYDQARSDAQWDQLAKDASWQAQQRRQSEETKEKLQAFLGVHP